MNFYSAFNLLNSEFLESILMNFCSIIELLLIIFGTHSEVFRF